MRYLATSLAFVLALASASVAQSQNEDWVDLGWFGDNLFRAAYDAAGARTERDDLGGVMVYVKITSASQAFVDQTGADPKAAYYSENFGVDCAKRVIRSYHLLSHDAQGGWVQLKSVDFGGATNTPTANTLAAILLQKVCGS